MASDIKYNVKGSISTNTKRGVIGSSGTYDHTKLNNRDAADQHPMQAITGLVDYLNNFSNRLQEIVQGLIDSDFQGQINRLNAQILNLIDYLPSTVSSSNKLVDQNQLNTRINEINETINQLNDDLSQDISQLDTRLTNSIQELSESFTEDLNTLSEALDSFEESITNSLNQEISDREAADQQLSDYVDSEIDKLDAKIKNDLEPRLTELSEAIDSEEDAREQADGVLQENIEAETDRATQAESDLQDAIEAEAERATAAEEDLRDYTDNEITKLDTKIKDDLEPRLTELSEAIEAEAEAREDADEALQEQIDDISIEELSRREVTRTYEVINPALNDKFVLATEYNSNVNYYRRVLDIDTNKLTGTWKLKQDVAPMNWEAWRALMGDDVEYFYSNIYSYWYTPAGVKKSYSYFGVIQPTRNQGSEWDETDDIWGFGVSDRFYLDAYGMIATPNSQSNGVMLLPIRHTRLFDNSVVDYNPCGTPGYITPGFDTISFEMPNETRKSMALASKLFTLIADKVSDTPLGFNDTNYKTRYDYVEITEEEFNENPGEYYYYKETFKDEIDPEELSTNDKKETGYYSVYEFKSGVTYYKKEYDVDDSHIFGIWTLPDEIPYVGDEDTRRIGWINDVLGYYYNGDGTRVDFKRFGVLGSPYRSDTDLFTRTWGVAVGEGWNGQYGVQECARYTFPEGVEALGGGGYANFRGQPENAMQTLYFTEDDSQHILAAFKELHPIKVSDKLLPFGDTNYETRFVPVELTADSFVPGKYFTYYDKENSHAEINSFLVLSKNFDQNEQYYVVSGTDPISKETLYEKVTLTEEQFYAPRTNYYKLISFDPISITYDVSRIVLNDEASYYRNSLGKDLIKITDTNVYIDGETLIPNLMVKSNTYKIITAENNAETVFNQPITDLKIIIPKEIKHGFCFYTTFETGTTDPQISFVNKSNVPLKFIFAGTRIQLSDLEFATETQYNLMFLCNGVYLEVYIQEIQLI